MVDVAATVGYCPSVYFNSGEEVDMRAGAKHSVVERLAGCLSSDEYFYKYSINYGYC